jgi:hypothetical protein
LYRNHCRSSSTSAAEALLVLRHEFIDIDHALAFDRDGFELLGIKLDVLALPDFIALMMSAGSLGRPARSGRLYCFSLLSFMRQS